MTNAKKSARNGSTAHQNPAFESEVPVDATMPGSSAPPAITRNKSISTLNEQNLQETFAYKRVKGDNAFKSTGNYVKKYYRPSGNCLLNYFFHRFPFFDWIRSYNLKEDLVKDLIAGLTIGVVHIPQ